MTATKKCEIEQNHVAYFWEIRTNDSNELLQLDKFCGPQRTLNFIVRG